MSKHTVYTSVTPLPPGVTRETVLAALHDHASMIDLNPMVIERHPCKAPGKCTPEEYNGIWYAITDRVSYLPGGLVSGQVTYYACFHDLPDGLQTHCYAPLGLDIRERWSVGGSAPGEPRQAPPMGIGAPKDGLYIREDIDMRCNIMATGFVKKNLKNAHKTLVDRMVEMSQVHENRIYNDRLAAGGQPAQHQSVSSLSHSNSFSTNSSSPGGVSPIAPRFPQQQQTTPYYQTQPVAQPYYQQQQNFPAAHPPSHQVVGELPADAVPSHQPEKSLPELPSMHVSPPSSNHHQQPQYQAFRPASSGQEGTEKKPPHYAAELEG